MNRKKNTKKTAETTILTAVIFSLNLLFSPDDPGFSGMLFSPYIISSLFAAVYFGRGFGFLGLALSALFSAGLLIKSNSSGLVFHSQNLTAAAAAIILVYIFGTIRETSRIKLSKIKERLKELIKENYRLRKIVSAQLEINRELEERVTRQRPTITTLYNQMHRMDSLNLGKSLDVLLETVELFTGASDITIWTQSQTPGFLYSPASRHKDHSFNPSELLSIENSIEGWVFRNNRMFSLRMATGIKHLKKLNTNRNIITMPIPINKKNWGVLNIEEMPFAKYNQYTEKLLEIIISLAETAMTRAVEHDRQIQQSETDADTGLPLFSQLYNILERNTAPPGEDGGRMSLLIIEIANYQSLCKDSPPAEVKKLFLSLIDDILMTTAGRADFFMHKSDNQMAVLIPGLDNDGASLLCLEILEKANTEGWRIENRSVLLELIIGFSSLGENAADAEGLVSQAEHLLEIQKL